MNFLSDLLFSQPDSPLRRALTYGVIAALFGAGLVHWVLFFDKGDMTFQRGDWPKEYVYYSVLQQAVQSGSIPYHVDPPLQKTQRFLAIPEKVLSPQILLLGFMSIGRFVMVNTLVMYAVGFWGCLIIRRRYALSLVSFAMLYLLFHFNGHITAHIAAGHSMWNGYFLMPFYCYCILRLCDTTGHRAGVDRRIPLILALTLFAMNLQGSFHLYLWNVLFIGLVAAFNTSHVRAMVTAVVFSGFLSCLVLLPAAITYWNTERMFLTGYPTVSVLLEAFVSIKRSDVPFPPALVGEVAWWEYDLFIGAVAFVALLYLGIWLRWRPTDSLRPTLEGTEYRELDWPMGLMVVLSMGALYGVIATLPLPLMNTLANPSRFLITPVLLLLVISCIRLERLLSVRGRLRAPAQSAVDWLLVAGLIQTGFELATHSKVWAARNWGRLPSGIEVGQQVSIVNQVDPVYEWTVHTSLAVSVLTLIVWTYCYLARSVTSSYRSEL